MKAFLCPIPGTRLVWGQWQPSALAGVGSAASPVLLVHHPIPAHFSRCRSPMLPPHCFLTSSFLLQGPAQPHASSSCSIYCPHRALHSATTSFPSPALCSKICLQSFRVCRAKTCPSRPTEAPIMAAMTNHRSASLYPSPGRCCCFYSLKF